MKHRLLTVLLPPGAGCWDRLRGRNMWGSGSFRGRGSQAEQNHGCAPVRPSLILRTRAFTLTLQRWMSVWYKSMSLDSHHFYKGPFSSALGGEGGGLCCAHRFYLLPLSIALWGALCTRKGDWWRMGGCVLVEVGALCNPFESRQGHSASAHMFSDFSWARS